MKRWLAVKGERNHNQTTTSRSYVPIAGFSMIGQLAAKWINNLRC